MDDTAKDMLRRFAEDFSNNMHDLRERLETNRAERRHRERKRNTANDEDEMVVEGEGEAWKVAQRRRGNRMPSAPGGPSTTAAAAGAHSPRRAGTPATGGASGSLSGAVAARLQRAGEAAGQPNGRGDGSART